MLLPPAILKPSAFLLAKDGPYEALKNNLINYLKFVFELEAIKKPKWPLCIKPTHWTRHCA
jgi:hypothetical protein